MARPIESTPTLTGDDADRLLDDMASAGTPDAGMVARRTQAARQFLADMSADSDARVRANRMSAAVRALATIAPSLGEVLVSNPRGSIEGVRGAVMEYRARQPHGSPAHAEATVARDTLGALWAVLW